ncbi:hypothetical protein DDZ18_12595 [Marinicauda salina]|uniref:DUF2336 domain-containing protein n=1 Tax=Marinicauda salina TaxID=2135793 RepID=A0A2U2BRI0_9PROT|nr:DUF2336 domain-containing protein [Marinicauda salina]PWE16599.1 hypothetical protein DDZ18_12595 [Marinicauda salina]
MTARDPGARQAGDDRRSRLAMAVTELCTTRRLSETASREIEPTLLELVRAVDRRVRVAMAERLADCEWAPPAVIQELAFDAIECARPVLERSVRLTIDDLLAAAEIGPDHRLALAGRGETPPRLTLALARHLEPPVIRRLAANPGAVLPDAAALDFASVARDDAELQALLAERPDLSERFASALQAVAADAIRQRLAERFPDLPADRLDAAAEAAAEADTRNGDAAAAALIAKLHARGQLDTVHLLRAARADRHDVLDHAISRLAGVDVEDWRTAVSRSGLRACALAGRAIGLADDEVEAVHESLRRAGHVHALEPARFRQALDEMQRLYSCEDARRALRRLGAAASIH